MEEALQHLTDATVSEALLRNLIDPVMEQWLKSAYAKLDELLEVHKEHPETRNHYFTDTYNALQRKRNAKRTTQVLQEAFRKRCDMNENDIPQLLALLNDEDEIDMDLIAAESTFNAMQAFYKASPPSIYYCLYTNCVVL